MTDNSSYDTTVLDGTDDARYKDDPVGVYEIMKPVAKEIAPSAHQQHQLPVKLLTDDGFVESEEEVKNMTTDSRPAPVERVMNEQHRTEATRIDMKGNATDNDVGVNKRGGSVKKAKADSRSAPLERASNNQHNTHASFTDTKRLLADNESLRRSDRYLTVVSTILVYLMVLCTGGLAYGVYLIYQLNYSVKYDLSPDIKRLADSFSNTGR